MMLWHRSKAPKDMCVMTANVRANNLYTSSLSSIFCRWKSSELHLIMCVLMGVKRWREGLFSWSVISTKKLALYHSVLQHRLACRHSACRDEVTQGPMADTARPMPGGGSGCSDCVLFNLQP
ncbi:hypothetical protein M3J09_001795 [Ascochyta lentis]